MKEHRIGIAFFYHESHSFSPIKTEIEQFRHEGYFIGDEIYDAYTGTKTEVGGFLDVLKQEKDVEIVPLVCGCDSLRGRINRSVLDYRKTNT